jgi:hypothetical protein
MAEVGSMANLGIFMSKYYWLAMNTTIVLPVFSIPEFFNESLRGFESNTIC